MSNDAKPTERPPWYRRRGLAVGAAVAVVVAITVITDLPVGTSKAQDVSAERSVMSELNTDVAPCSLAVHQALGIWQLQAAHQLTSGERSGSAGLLSDDQAACSFTDENVFDLTNIEVPGSPAGKKLGDLVATATLWTTSDALHAIEDVQTLINDPTNASDLTNLATQERQLARDRQAAIGEVDAANRLLGTSLPAPSLAPEPQPPAG